MRMYNHSQKPNKRNLPRFRIRNLPKQKANKKIAKNHKKMPKSQKKEKFKKRKRKNNPKSLSNNKCKNRTLQSQIKIRKRKKISLI